MILMNRDRLILQFIEKYGSISISQCAKIFFTKNKYSKYQARIRLKQLSDNGFLKRYRENMQSETIYYINKKLSIHDLKTLDIYALLSEIGADIIYFKREYVIETTNKQYRADALIEFIHNDYWYSLLVEIDYTHFTSEKKLIDIYNSNYFQNKYSKKGENVFPIILIIRPNIPKDKINTNLFTIYYLTLSLSNFIQVLD